jgi:hypothetical protein
MRFATTFLCAVTALLALACGEGDSTGSDVSALTADQTARYAEVERCTGLRAPAPAVRLEAAIACPNGEMCCRESFGEFECDEGTCGMGGYYDPREQTILLPDRCSKLFRHEAVHHLLFVNDRPDWNDHAAPEFRCG